MTGLFQFYCGFSFLAGLVTDDAALKGRESTISSGQDQGGSHRTRCRTPGALVFCLLSAMTFGVSRAAEPVFDIDIPVMNAAEALNRLAEQTGAAMLFSYDLARAHEANAIRGRYTLLEGLELLLQDTGLSGGLSDKRVVVIADEGHMPVGKGENVKSRGMLARIAAVLAAIVATDVKADQESSSTKLEEVLVTAQKREERTIDVPMSITALSGEQLADAGIRNALDLSYAVPGLTVAETGPGRQVIVIRGIGSIRGSSSLTGLYLDEMPVTGAQAGFVANYADLRLIDLSRVEVLRGPQGTLFGEGAAGGVIRYITNDPDLSRVGGSLTTEFYNTADGGWSEEVTGITNVPFTESFGIRLAAVYENKSGWIDQPSIGRKDINDSEVKHVRAKAMWIPTPELQIRGTAEIHRNDGGASNIVNQFPRKDSNFLQAFDRAAPTDYADDYDLFNVALTYSLGFADFLSSTSYASLENVQSFTQLLGEEPTPSLEILIRELSQEASITSQEFRLTSATNGAAKWTAGASYKDAKLTNGFGNAGLDAVLFGGTPDEFSISGISSGNKPTTKSESWAAFADLSYRISNRVEVGGGLRYFYDQREASDPTVPALGTLSENFDEPTFRTYLKYQASPAANLYVSIASGFRSGGFNGSIPLGAPPSYDAEKTIFYEVGSKMSLAGGRVRADGALFYGEFQDMQDDKIIISPVDGVTPIQFTSNGQDAEVKGFEWDISWLVTDRLTITFSGDRTDSEVTSVDSTNLGAAFFVGDPINLVPKYSLSTSADYGFHWLDSVPGFFRVSFDRQGESYFSGRSNPLVTVTQAVAPEVNFLNASVGAEWNGWQWKVFGRNLLDEDNILNAAIEGWTAQARPRTIGITLGKTF